MNKEIKFRAWDKAQEIPKMVTWDECLRHFSDCYKMNLDPFKDPYLTWMQFTGFYDKINKEIYEGDILTYLGEGLFVVDMSESSFIKPLNDDSSNIEIDSDRLFERSFYFKIIGNIFENPNLMQ